MHKEKKKKERNMRIRNAFEEIVLLALYSK